MRGAVLEGQDEYAGLTAIMHDDEGTMGTDPDINGVGVIFEGEMPPMPDPVEPAAE